MRQTLLITTAFLGVAVVGAAVGYGMYVVIKRNTEDAILKAAAANSQNVGRGIGEGAVSSLFRNVEVLLSGEGGGDNTSVLMEDGF